jgi:drug/metabolite transporter (DMT)-like permease
VPLFAALIAWLVFRERVRFATWLAIAAVILGVAIMVSDAFTGRVSPIGDGLALLIATSLSIATVITRRYSHVGMTPATCLAALLAALGGRAPDDVVNIGGVEAVAFGQSLQHGGAKTLGVQVSQGAFAHLADAARGAAGIDDVGFGHDVSS